jgi:hypothetical protein
MWEFIRNCKVVWLDTDNLTPFYDHVDNEGAPYDQWEMALNQLTQDIQSGKAREEWERREKEAKDMLRKQGEQL